jgi:predicted FMN-binding regulatory protein PaiB
MSYPPPWRYNPEPALALQLMREHPFGHLFSAHPSLHASRIPFITDTEDSRPTRLRAHLNAQNPQVEGLHDSPVLVTFSGCATYVSPHWRIENTRGGTYDFEQVTVRGTARVVEGIDSFRTMINDLSSLIEPQYAEAGDYPTWQTTMAAPGYLEAMYPHITQFEIEIEDIQTISKLHQQFPTEDRVSIAEHLERINRDDARIIATKIRHSIEHPNPDA